MQSNMKQMLWKIASGAVNLSLDMRKSHGGTITLLFVCGISVALPR